jgi:hypothetical protein
VASSAIRSMAEARGLTSIDPSDGSFSSAISRALL